MFRLLAAKPSTTSCPVADTMMALRRGNRSI